MLPKRIRAVLLDLDGVVYLEHTPIAGAARAIAALRARGITVLFATNNATHTRSMFARRLTAMGIPCTRADLMNASFATARKLRRELPRGARVFIFGRGGLEAELAAAGLTPVTCRTRAEFQRHRRTDPRIRAVAVSYHQALTFWSLCAAHVAVRRGARLIGCNLDPTYPGTDLILPGTGSLATMLATSTGRTPELVGKPAPALFRLLLAERRIAARDVLVVGDRLDIDVAAGKAAGAATALVLTGVDTRADVRRSRIRPDVVLRGLPDLLRLSALR